MIPNHSIENNQKFSHTGGNNNFEGFAFIMQSLREAMNNRIATHCGKSGHIKDAAYLLSPSPDPRFANEASGAEVKWCNADQGSDLLTVELSQLGQLGEENCTGLGSDAGSAAKNLVLLTKVIIGLDMLLDEFVELPDLEVESFNHLSNALSDTRVADGFHPVRLLGMQVCELTSSTDKVCKLVRLAGGKAFGLRLNDLCETGDYACVYFIRFCPLAEAAGEIANLFWRSDNNLEACLEQLCGDKTFVAAVASRTTSSTE